MKFEFFEKYTLKNFENFSMVFEYHEKLNFTKLEYQKNSRSLYIFETIVDCSIVYENVLFDYFCQIK